LLPTIIRRYFLDDQLQVFDLLCVRLVLLQQLCVPRLADMLVCRMGGVAT
jgi:hypothetical protein